MSSFVRRIQKRAQKLVTKGAGSRLGVHTTVIASKREARGSRRGKKRRSVRGKSNVYSLS